MVGIELGTSQTCAFCAAALSPRLVSASGVLLEACADEVDSRQCRMAEPVEEDGVGIVEIHFAGGPVRLSCLEFSYGLGGVTQPRQSEGAVVRANVGGEEFTG